MTARRQHIWVRLTTAEKCNEADRSDDLDGGPCGSTRPVGCWGRPLVTGHWEVSLVAVPLYHQWQAAGVGPRGGQPTRSEGSLERRRPPARCPPGGQGPTHHEERGPQANRWGSQHCHHLQGCRRSMECRVQKGAKNRNNAAQVISSLAAYACPLIGKKPVADISTDDFLEPWHYHRPKAGQARDKAALAGRCAG